MNMNTTIIALTASAFVLTGLLLVQHSMPDAHDPTTRITDLASLASQADAAGQGFIVTDGSIQVLTAPFDQDEDYIYVLDSVTGRMIIYRLDRRGGNIITRIVDQFDVNQALKTAEARLPK